MRVWLVDDSEADLYLLQRAVRRACPEAQVSTFQSLHEAIERWRASVPDCLFLDINLGADSGFEWVDLIDEASHRAPSINVLLSGVPPSRSMTERLGSTRVPWQVKQKPLREQQIIEILEQAGVSQGYGNGR